MSYRAFKRLLGETSLERKCRFLFGAGILLLITASFWLYAYQTEHLAYDQTTTTCRLLVNQCFDKEHLKKVIGWQQKQLEKSPGGTAPQTEALKQMLQSRDEADKETADKHHIEYQYHPIWEDERPRGEQRQL